MGISGFKTDNRPALAKIDRLAGHALFIDDSDKFNAVLNEFPTSLKK
jgi:hypothetical protein